MAIFNSLKSLFFHLWILSEFEDADIVEVFMTSTSDSNMGKPFFSKTKLGFSMSSEIMDSSVINEFLSVKPFHPVRVNDISAVISSSSNLIKEEMLVLREIRKLCLNRTHLYLL